MDYLTGLSYDALDQGILPDFAVRRAIRYLCNQRLHDISTASMEEQVDSKWLYIEKLKQGAIAIETDAANDQHYEVRPHPLLPSHSRFDCTKTDPHP